MSTTPDIQADERGSEGVSHHPPSQARRPGTPMRGYAVLMSAYAGVTGTLLYRAKREQRIPERPRADDILLVAMATQRVSRLITKDRVTTVVRAPFTTYQGEGGPAEVEEAARGTGLRRAIGELLVCPFCIAQWTATALSIGILFAPRLTRFVAGVFATVGLADMLQLVYKRSERTALGD
jgi:uncharacterized protein DUF1360